MSRPAPEAQALVLDPRQPADAKTLEQLRADPGTVVVDRLAALTDELRSLRGLNPALTDEPPRWVWYPWRRTLVAVLGPEGFRAVRLDRNRNKITAAAQDRFRSARIGIVGLSVGHVIAHTLAMEGLCGELRLADFDDIELSNLNRIPASLLDLGVNKAVVAARRIAEIDPYVVVSVEPEGLTEANLAGFFDGLDLVIEECDSLDMKLVVREAARERRIPVVMETSDRGLLDVERFDIEPDRALFHGLLGEVSADNLRGLSTHDKVPYVLDILEPAELSASMAASMAEIDYSLSSWPQLGGDVTLGAATVAAAARRILGPGDLPSGRLRIDLDRALSDLQVPPPPRRLDGPADTWVPSPPAGPARAVAHAASLAPSGGNVQPWRLVLSSESLAIHLVPERSSRMDVQYRGSLVAIGAALYNARVAAAHHGVLGPAHLRDDPGSLERACLELGSGTDAELAAQYPAVLSRCSNRQVGPDRPIEGAALSTLRSAAEAEGGRLLVFQEPSERRAVAELLAESDRVRYLSPDLHREMMSELRWPPEDPLDLGLDVRTLSLDATDLAKLGVARRPDVMARLAEWDLGQALGETTLERVSAASAVLVVTVEGGATRDYLRGGMALQRCWLAAEQHGLGLQPVSPAFLYASDQNDIASLVPAQFTGHLAELRERFRDLVGLGSTETTILILRATYAPAPVFRSRRLALTDVAEEIHPSA